MLDIQKLIKEAIGQNPTYKGTPPIVADPNQPFYNPDALHPGANARQKYGDVKIIAPPLNEVPQSPPVEVDQNDIARELAVGMAPAKSPLESAQGEYAAALGAPAKANPWLTGLHLALQGVGQVLAPNGQPIRNLGDIRKAEKVSKAKGVLDAATQSAEFNTTQAYKRGQIDEFKNRDEDRRRDNERQDKNLTRQEKADERKGKYWDRKADQGDLKLAQDAELIALRDKWATSDDERDVRRLNLVEEEMKNRNIRADADRASREKIAGQSQAGQDRRVQTMSALRIKERELSAALADKNNAASQQRARAIQDEMIRLRKSLDD